LACFAPASRVSTLCFLAGHCLSLPFDLALLLRLILTSLSLFPILAGGMRLSRLVSRPVLISLGCALFSLLYRGASFLCTLFLRNSIWIYLLPFPYTDAAESFLGSYPSQGIHAPPLFSLAFLIGLTGILILLPIEKKSSPQSEENSPTESDEASSLPQ